MEGAVNTSASDMKHALAATYRNRMRRLLFALNTLESVGDNATEGDETKINVEVDGGWAFAANPAPGATAASQPGEFKFSTVQPINLTKMKRMLRIARAASILTSGERVTPIVAEGVWGQLENDTLLNHADRAGYAKAAAINGALDLSRYNPAPSELNAPIVYANLSTSEFPLTRTAVGSGGDQSQKTFYVTDDAVCRIMPQAMPVLDGAGMAEIPPSTDMLVEVYTDRDEDTVKTRVFGFDNFVVKRPQGVLVTTDLIKV